MKSHRHIHHTSIHNGSYASLEQPPPMFYDDPMSTRPERQAKRCVCTWYVRERQNNPVYNELMTHVEEYADEIDAPKKSQSQMTAYANASS